MKRFLAPLCAVCFVAFPASGFKIPEKEYAVDGSTDAESKMAASEAILVGQVLRHVAQNLAQDNKLHGEVNEYFIAEIFGMITKGVQEVVEGVATTVKKVGDEVKGIVDAARGWNSRLSIREDLQQKATKVLTRVFDTTVASYTLTDSKDGGDFVKYLCGRVDTVGRRLIERGGKFFDIYDANF